MCRRRQKRQTRRQDDGARPKPSAAATDSQVPARVEALAVPPAHEFARQAAQAQAEAAEKKCCPARRDRLRSVPDGVEDRR